MITNPVLKGFHPDPSMIYVGGFYYIAVSTFEWYPGVRIYRSADLENWEFVGAPLDSPELLDLRGIRSSCGVWAPDLSWKDGYFYLVYTSVHTTYGSPVQECPNYVIRAKDIQGPWSEPVYVNSSGFDPSLFHDEDGRSWFLNMEWDFRKVSDGNGRQFTGILAQEYDTELGVLKGEAVHIFYGTKLRFLEGPHLYKYHGMYYLFCAEGGTSWHHGETVARSKHILGPYVEDPEGPIITSWEGTLDSDFFEAEFPVIGMGNSYLKKAGHASICENEKHEWYLAHLCSRPVPGTRYCVLGRETAIQKLQWNDSGWPRIESPDHHPAVFVETGIKELEDHCLEKECREYFFTDESFRKDFQTLRIPWEKKYFSVKERKGYLRIRGRESVFSRYYQSLLARRQTCFSFTAGTEMEFVPESFMHMAGLIYRYDEENFHYLYISHDEQLGTTLNIMACTGGKWTLPRSADSHGACIAGCPDEDTLPNRSGFGETCIPVKGNRFGLRIDVNGQYGQFWYQETQEHKEWKKIGVPFSVLHLSDDYTSGFTGAFVGICVQDLRNQTKYADFSYFFYKEI